MKIAVIAKARAREEKVEKKDLGSASTGSATIQEVYIVSVKEPAKEGRANWAIERTLAKHFGVSPTRVRIISGHASKTKIVEVLYP